MTIAITIEDVQEDGSPEVTRFERSYNGTWYNDEFQPLGPTRMAALVEAWIEGTYEVPREKEEA